MKKKLFVAIAAIAIATNLNAQQNIIKANPLGLLLGSAELSYERVLSEKGSVELSLSYTRLDATFSDGSEENLTGFGAEGKYKFYFSSKKLSPRGWYAAPVVTYYTATGDSNESEGDVNVFAGGAVAGYQWVFGKKNSGFALDLNLGIQYASVNTSDNITDNSAEGLIPRIGLALGYAF